ncbi:MAG: diguanylate cyclase [Pseudomonadota bacterium]
MPAADTDEASRLAALADLDALDSPRDDLLDTLVALAANVCGQPYSAISLIDEHRQWFQAVHGLEDASEQPRTLSMCNHAVEQGQLLEISDARADARFAAHPMVVGPPALRHYAAMPLVTADGHAVGSFCVFGPRPGRLERSQRLALEQLASIALKTLQRRVHQHDDTGFTTQAILALGNLHLYHRAPVIMALVDDGGHLLDVTDHWLEVFGCTREYATGRSIGEFMTPGSRRKADTQTRPRFLRHGRVDDVRYRFVSHVGGTFEGELSARRARDAAGRWLTVAVIFDVTATRRAQVALQGANDRLTTTLNSIGEGVLATDSEHQVRYINPAGSHMLGITADAALGRPLEQVYPLIDHGDKKRSDLAREAYNETRTLVTHQGEQLTVEQTVSPMHDPEDAGMVLVFRDVTAQRRLQQRISYQARHDALTGLYNRYEFEQRLRQATLNARDGQGEHAIMYLDLDHFKAINDTVGHGAGDECLRQLSTLLQGTLRQGDTVARLGGDEFAVLVEQCSQAQALRLATLLLERITEYRYRVTEREFGVGVSIGLVPITHRNTDPELLRRWADEACYRAKRDGGNRVVLHKAS